MGRPLGTIKVNWDATIDKNLGRVSFGTIAWDSAGNVLAARSVTTSILIDPTIAEAWAALHAIIFVKEIGMFDIILEGDAKQVVDKINSDSPTLNRFGYFIEGTRSELGYLRSFHVVHVRREANLTAHYLVRAVVAHVR